MLVRLCEDQLFEYEHFVCHRIMKVFGWPEVGDDRQVLPIYFKRRDGEAQNLTHGFGSDIGINPR